MKAKDYMYLPKKRLAEMLEERDNLEEKIEDIIAKRVAELSEKQLLQSEKYPNPFNEIVTVYGCPSIGPVVYSKGEITSISKEIEQ